MKTLNQVCQVKVITKTLPLPKHEDIILTSMTQIREKWDSRVLSWTAF